MSSRLILGSKPARLIYSTKATQKSPIRWSRKADGRNYCIGSKLRHQHFPGVGMASSSNAKGSAFKGAVSACPRA